MEGEDLGCEVIEVDIDQNRELCEKYNIRGVPILVYVGQGQMLVGNICYPKLRSG